MSVVTSNYEIPVFYPTYEEFKDFSAFISSIEQRGAHKIGLAKIVPPKEWVARKAGYKQKQIEEKLVENPIKQEMRGRDGIYSVVNIQQRSIKLSSFQKLASSSRYAPPASICNDLEKLEKKYWQSLTSNAPIYGADVNGSFYDENQTIWNVNNLGTILDDLSTEYGMKIQGVNTAYLYFGMWRASFAWHTEDMDLYSINYLHFGAPKQWYVIPPLYAKRFEQFISSRFPSLARRCPAFLRHKMTVVSPSMLTKQSIPYAKMTQYEGEFMITFPYGYHAGFNYGFNCAESTNFALERWIEYGKHSVKCTCREDMVKISMDSFVYKYQPHLYDDWCRGINLTKHPEEEEWNKLDESTLNDLLLREKQLLSSNDCQQSHVKSSSTNKLSSISHQEKISNQRYISIFRDLENFDEQYKLSIDQYSTPLVRAALSRAQCEIRNEPQKKFTKLLHLTANLLFNKVSSKSVSFPNLFYGLQHSGKYRESILNGLWNYQSLNPNVEHIFNQWLCNQSTSCSICRFFNVNPTNKSDSNKKSSIHHLLMSETSYNSMNDSSELLQCSICRICVHRECYESVCLAMKADVTNEYHPWLCQRCSFKIQNPSSQIDDRCSACLLHGGLLLYPQLSSSFIHAVCSIYQSYQSSSSSQSHSCFYCLPFCPLNYHQMSTQIFVCCKYSHCKNSFHLTCGFLNGCTFQIDNNNSNIHVRCHLHASDFSDNSSISIRTDDNVTIDEYKCLPKGTRVLINNRNEQQIGHILSNEIIYHYSVDFGDDTYSHDMLAEDIVDCDPSTLEINSNIRVKWTDGTIYACKYLGRKQVVLYHIKIDNNIRQMQRNEFSLVVQPLSPPSTSCETESELDSNQQSPTNSPIKRQNQQQKQPIKSKRRRLILSSSSDDEES